jgi:hypothetical protein
MRKSQIPPDLVVRSQAVDIIILILSLIRRKTLSTISRVVYLYAADKYPPLIPRQDIFLPIV